MKKIIFTILFLLTVILSIGQSVEISGVKGRFYSGVHPIEDYGYYTIYKGEKLKKGMVEFVLEIFDLDLNQITKEKIVLSKSTSLLGAEFNGQNFMFVFADFRKKTSTYITYDTKGAQLKQEVNPSKKVATVATTRLFPAKDGSGFYVTTMVKEKKWGYRVQKIDKNLTQIWDKTYTRAKGVASIVHAEVDRGKLILLTNERPSMSSRKVMSKLIALNDESGDEIYSYDLFNGEVTCQPTVFYVEEDGTLVTSGMYFNGEKFKATNSDGIFFTKLSPTGEEITLKTIDWDNGIQEALKATSRKFSIGSKPKVMFHEIIPEPGGGYQVISETFRKTVKAGTVLAALGGNNNQPPPMGFTIMDFLIFNFANDGTPTDINKIVKPYKSALVDGTIASQGGIILAMYMKAMGMFTYEFTTKLEGSDQRVIVYTNFEDAGIGKGKPYIGITTIDPGQESKTRKMPVTKKHTPYLSGSKNTKAGVMKGKPGKMCLYIYSKKEKIINMTIENISMD